MLRGVSLSAAPKVSEEKKIRDRRNLLRIRSLPALFDRRALNRITQCCLRSKSIVGRIVCRANPLPGKSWPGPGDAHRNLDAIPGAVSARSKCCTNRGDCYTNSEHPAL